MTVYDNMAFGLKLRKKPKEEIDEIVDVKAFTGRAEKQVEEYVSEVVDPLIDKNGKDAIETGAVTV